MTAPLNMGYLHALAALVLAGYLYKVWMAGNTDRLYAAAREDVGGFVKWGLASAVLLWLLGNVLGKWGVGLGALLITAAVLRVGPDIIAGVDLIIDNEPKLRVVK